LLGAADTPYGEVANFVIYVGLWWLCSSLRKDAQMNTDRLAEFYALLTMLEPDTETCRLAQRLADVGTTGLVGESSDTTVLQELRGKADKVARELSSVDSAKIDAKSELIAKMLAGASAS
jgi:hypothetical protein